MPEPGSRTPGGDGVSDRVQNACFRHHPGISHCIYLQEEVERGAWLSMLSELFEAYQINSAINKCIYIPPLKGFGAFVR